MLKFNFHMNISDKIIKTSIRKIIINQLEVRHATTALILFGKRKKILYFSLKTLKEYLSN